MDFNNLSKSMLMAYYYLVTCQLKKEQHQEPLQVTRGKYLKKKDFPTRKKRNIVLYDNPFVTFTCFRNGMAAQILCCTANSVKKVVELLWL